MDIEGFARGVRDPAYFLRSMYIHDVVGYRANYSFHRLTNIKFPSMG